MRSVRKTKTAVILAGKLVFSAVGLSTFMPATAAAEKFDAGKVMNSMSDDERSGYIAGVVEGLAIARYMKDGKQKAGMDCIYAWYYEDTANIRLIFAAFDKYPTYPPGSLIDVLVKQKCGE